MCTSRAPRLSDRRKGRGALLALAIACVLLPLPSLSFGTLSSLGTSVASPISRALGDEGGAQAGPWSPAEGRTSLAPVPTVPSSSSSFTWSNLSALSSSPAPSPREGPSTAYDPADGVLVVFGGTSPSGLALDDTWTYQNRTWTNVTSGSPTSPSPRIGAGMAWDPSLRELVLYGGLGVSGALLNDTWTFASGRWSNVSSGLRVSPPPMYAPSLTTDSTDGDVLLFGGAWAGGAFSQTWVWKGGGWTNLTSAAGAPPPGRLWAAVSDDPWDGGVLVYGGYDDNVTYFSDTWLYHGGSWTNLTSVVSSSPGPLIEGALLVEGANRSLVLAFGSRVPSATGVPVLNPYTWVWQGGAWSNVSGAVALAPPPRDLAGVAAFSAGGGMGAVFGGLGATSDLSDLEMLHVPLNVAASVAPTPVPVGTAVSCSSQVRGGAAPVALQWNLGDGTVALTANTSHPYAQPGTYPIRFTATDALGASVSRNFSVHVVAGLAVTVASLLTSLDVGMSESFTSTVLGGSSPYTYLWTFGDGGNGSTTPAPTHVYTRSGSFLVRLNVSDGLGLTGTAFTNVSVALLPTAVVAASLNTPAVGQSVLFSSSVVGGTGPLTFGWTFGDGVKAASQNATHAFATSGIFNATLRVTDSLGRSDNASLRVTVSSTGSPLTSTLRVTPVRGNTSTVFDFNASASGGTPPYTFLWSFGDGQSAAGPQVTHTFAVGRTAPYNVTLNVTDLDGIKVEASLAVTVNTSTSPAPGGNSPPSKGTAGQAAGEVEIVGALAVVLAAVAMVLYLRGKRDRRGERGDLGPEQGSSPAPEPSSSENQGGSPPPEGGSKDPA